MKGTITMKKIIINENQRGLLFKNGKFVKLLGAGKYLLFGGRDIEVFSIEHPHYAIASRKCNIETLLADEIFASSVEVVDIADQEYVLHYVNGKFTSLLNIQGKWAFWKGTNTHEFKKIDVSSPIVDESVPEYIFSKIPASCYTKVEVAECQKARIYFNRKPECILGAGTYYFWNNGIRVDVDLIDTRLTQMNITGQEILTADKVSIRVNLVVNHRIADYEKIFTEVDDYCEQIHVAAQLALREYVGRYKLDEILERKDEMSQFIFDRLKAKEGDFYVEIREAGVKDIILPGEIREIMNTVLVAEKRAQANVITRREEVASTRSLLNTAKLMDENKTLYKLKELEFVERICENVGNINLGGSGDIVTQLVGLLNTN